MKYAILIPLTASLLATGSLAQGRIYRCGNEYTNTLPAGKTKGCKLVEGGNVTVVQSARPPAATPARVGPGSQRVDSAEQRARDSDARMILESELKKAEAREAQLRQEYNNGEPERRSDETHNYQKYLDRIAELKANLGRVEEDIAGIRRELSRMGPTTAKK